MSTQPVKVAGVAVCDALMSPELAQVHRHCSTDRTEVWHGLDTPALACGFHTRYFLEHVFAGHDARLAA